MKGRIHSIESFGTVDGPGVRLVVFMQGCPLRCRYCHNPDTWDKGGGTEIGSEEIIEQYRKNKYFYRKGGITVTGGEPLLQVDFLIELFTLAKGEGIHTCIDTSGITYREDDTPYNRKLDRLLDLCDLILLDIKHIDSAAHRELTGRHNDGILAFAEHLSERNIPVWIRHVVVPGITDDPDVLRRLGRFVGGLKNVKALDVLPYHTMGVHKYRELGLEYTLENVESMSVDKAAEAKKYILDGFYAARGNHHG